MYCPKRLLFNLSLSAVAQENPRQVPVDRYDSVFFHFCLSRSYLALWSTFWSLQAPTSSSPNWLFYQELLWSWEPGWARGRETGLEMMKVKRKRLDSAKQTARAFKCLIHSTHTVRPEHSCYLGRSSDHIRVEISFPLFCLWFLFH